MERELQKLSWLKVRDLVPSRIDTVILPVGTVEAHGTDCLGTDNYIPENIAHGIAERINALIAPTLPFGISKSLHRYSGCVTLRPDTFAQCLGDIVESEELALSSSDETNNRFAAKVLGPSKSSEGQYLYYLIEWLR